MAWEGDSSAFSGHGKARKCLMLYDLRVSPFHHVSRGAPPAIIFHGKADTTVPYVTAELFAKKMTGRSN